MDGVSLADLSGYMGNAGSSLMDFVNSGATPQTNAMAASMAAGSMTPSQAFHSIANPNAVMNAPVSQFAGMTGGITRQQALMDLQRRIATGVEGLQGEPKYAALREIARQLREFGGSVSPTGATEMAPADQQAMRDMLERLMNAGQNLP